MSGMHLNALLPCQPNVAAARPGRAYLHNVLPRVALLQVPIRVRRAVAPLMNALRQTLGRVAVCHRADPQDEVGCELGPVAGLQLLGHRYKLLHSQEQA